MLTLAQQVLEHAAGLPEDTPLVAEELLHLGNRAVIDQVLSRLVTRGTLLRAGAKFTDGRPVQHAFNSSSQTRCRFGLRFPDGHEHLDD